MASTLSVTSQVWARTFRITPSVHPTHLSTLAPRGSGSKFADRDVVQKIIRSFLLIRRLLGDLVRYAPQVPSQVTSEAKAETPCSLWVSASDESSPLQLAGEVNNEFSEGASFEIGKIDRIVCSIFAPSGKKTRYLVLHDFWLLLCEPDLSMPGFAIVTTLWPLRQVTSFKDRSDPRTLRIGMCALPGGPLPREASASSIPLCPPPAGMEKSQSSYFALTLHFEDVKACHCADLHISGRIQEVRAQLVRQALAFVDRYCVQPLPCEV